LESSIALPPGVRSQRVESVLRSLQNAQRLHCGGAGIHAEATRGLLTRIPHRCRCDKTACIDGIEGDVRSSRSVQRGPQLGLVIDAVKIQSTREVNQRFLFSDQAEHVDGGLQGRELAVGIEEVELAAVLAEVGSGVLGDVLVFRIEQPLNRADQAIFVIGEIAADANGAIGIGEERDEIGALSSLFR
jgi:hypothetical protein